MKALFPLGQTFATRGIVDLGVYVAPLLHRHSCGDWGDLDSTDKQANESALLAGERILSCYRIGGSKVYVITEWDRTMTTVMLAEEY